MTGPAGTPQTTGMKRVIISCGWVLALAACDRQADVGELPVGAPCASSTECGPGLACLRDVCVESSREGSVRGDSNNNPPPGDAGIATNELAIENLSARLVRRYQCAAGGIDAVGAPILIECGDYEVSFSLANGTVELTDRLTHLELNIGGIRVVQNPTCQGSPWLLGAGQMSDIVTVRFWYSAAAAGSAGYDTDAAIAYPCEYPRMPEVWTHSGLPPVIRTGDVQIGLSVLLNNAERKDVSATVALRDDT